MPLVAFRVKQGTKFSVYVLSENGKCALTDFLESLSDKESGIIRRYWEYTADIGLLSGEKSKKLDNGMAYWRTPGGVRMFYFTDAGRVVVCTNAYIKKKDKLDPSEIKRAEIWKAKYEAAKRTDTLEFEDQ